MRHQHKIPDDYVAMAEHICPVCCVKHTFDTEILIHKNLRSIPEDKRITGWGLCEEHARLKNEGYVALVGCDEAKSKKSPNGNIMPEDAYRIGDIAHLRKSAFEHVFNSAPPEGMAVFCDVEVIKYLSEMQHVAEQ